MKRIGLITFLIIFFFSNIIIAQIPKESWRDHLSYTRGVRVAITPSKVYFAALRAGMLSYNRSTGEIEKYSKVTGLSDIGISTLSYSETMEMLIIGYSSGNIDLLTHNGIINIADIKNKRMISAKTINKIFCIDKYAYLACDFGIVLLDLEKIEVKDSYLFGPLGNIIKVNDLTIQNNFIYAATELSIYKADLSSPNLLDYANWELLTDVPDYSSEFKFISSFQGKLFTVYKSPSTGQSRILIFDNNNWNNWNIPYDTLINNLDVYHNTLSITGVNDIKFYNTQLQEISSYNVPAGKHAQIADDGIVYTAGMAYGFYMFEQGEGKYLGVINPRFNTTGKIYSKGDYIWVGSGGPFQKYFEGGAYIYYDNQWKSVNSGYTAGLQGVGNLYKFAFYPGNPNRVFASGYEYGLYEFNNFEIVNTSTWANTPLFRTTIDSIAQIRIMGLDFDYKNDLWTIMDVTDQPVYVLKSTGEWKNLSLKSEIFTKSSNFIDLEVTSNNQVWILGKQKGIVVLKEESDGSIKERAFAIKNQDGDLLSVAYSITEDKDGDLWIGTNKGPVIYHPDDNIFSDSDVKGTQIAIPRNDGTNLADFLLDYEILNEIAVDGGNRKWIATENSGVFLISPDGKKTIEHFTFENSPLISNDVFGIAVHESTGEVFMSTKYGIVSYMGTASEGNDDYSNVYVFPNPVRPEYNGLVTITGLIANSNVKITDISGNIVYETTSEGGQATWDGKNYYGSRAATGVYLVFLINEDGTKTYITKFLFIH